MKNFLLCLLFFVAPLCAETVESIPDPQRANRSWVSDNAEVIDAAHETLINRAIENFKKQTGGEIAVVTVNNTNGEDPKPFATALLNRWGVGQKGKDNGVLILLVMQSRRIEVETGYGVEGDLPDGKVGEILDNHAVPHFKRGDFGGGLLATTRAVIQNLGGTLPQPKAPRTSAPLRNVPLPAPPPASAPIINAPLRDAPIYNDGQTSARRSSGPFDVIIGLFILALFPIGIGVLIWGAIAIFQQFAKRKCQMCGREMRRLDENEEDAFLSSDQQFEERLGGLDYKVWKCDTCGVCHIERTTRWASNYKDCPTCQHCTMQVTSETVRQPTQYRTGARVTHYYCKYPGCHHKEKIRTEIPVLQPVTHHHHHGSSWGGSSGSSSSSGSSWGGSSGSSSGGFSSSSGSFGGGSSGGGGAGRSW